MAVESPWVTAHRGEQWARVLADRHYNRRRVGSPQFVPPGRCVVLLADDGGAVWVTSWPYARYVKHAWPGAWVNSCFRREHGERASDLIRAAVAATRAVWPEVPDSGMITFVDAHRVRRKRDPGRCYLRAGFQPAGTTRGGLLAFRLRPRDMPAPVPAARRQGTLF